MAKKEENKTKIEKQEEEERKIINKFPFVSEEKKKKIFRDKIPSSRHKNFLHFVGKKKCR